jgi:hypothetical protein
MVPYPEQFLGPGSTKELYPNPNCPQAGTIWVPDTVVTGTGAMLELYVPSRVE